MALCHWHRMTQEVGGHSDPCKQACRAHSTSHGATTVGGILRLIPPQHFLLPLHHQGTYNCYFQTFTASGPDLIAYSLLTHLPLAQQHLLTIYNWSWSSHAFPSCWKPATIIPIHKPGKDADSSASYHPISLTTCIFKLFERLVLSHLYYYLE